MPHWSRPRPQAYTSPMPFDPHVFRHTPALLGQITPPDASEMRFEQARFDELDQQAAEEGWADGWRMDHTAREANRQTVLKGRLAQDLWIFAYGSLIWDPAVEVDEYRYATLSGWHRQFCMRVERGRGTPENPGLMAALIAGGACSGVVIRIPGRLVDQETRYMWRREMFSGSYRPMFQTVETPQGPLDALIFAMDQSHHRYMPDLSEDTTARMIALAEGNGGTNFAYLDSLVRHLSDLGIEDADMRRLHQKAETHRRAKAS